MTGEQPPPRPAAMDAAGTQSVQTRALSSQQRKALARDRMKLLTYLKLVPIFAVGGEVLFWFVGLFERATVPDRGLIIFAPIFAVALLTGYFLVLDVRVAVTRVHGKYTRFTGPMRIDTEARPQSDGSTRTVNKLVLGTFATLDLTAKAAADLQSRLTEIGEADLGRRGHRLLEVRNDAGVTIFLDDALREAIGTTAREIPPTSAQR